MTKNSKSKDVTIRGGKNVAFGPPWLKKTPKDDTTEPKSPETTTTDPPEKPTE